MTSVGQTIDAEDAPATAATSPKVVDAGDELPIIALGADFRTTPLDGLERLAVAHRDVRSSLRRLIGDGVGEAALLVTCHRVELYGGLERSEVAEVAEITARLAELVQPADGSRQTLTVRAGRSAVAHLIAVAAGLESAVLGEGEILGQVRRAAETARKAGAAGLILDRLFQHAIRHGRAIRGRLGLVRADRSLSRLALDVVAAKREPGTLAGAAVIGTGEVATGVLERLREAGTSRLIVVSRKAARAAAIGEPFGAEAWELADLPLVAADVDVLVLATAATSPILRPGDLAARDPADPLLVVDLGLPRNADPRVAELPTVDLVDIATLIEVAGGGDRREFLLKDVEAELAGAADEFAQWYRCSQIGPVLAELRCRYEQVILEETLRSLPPVAEADVEGPARLLANRLAGKLLHQPVVGLKEIAVEESTDKAAELGRKLFLAGVDGRG